MSIDEVFVVNTDSLPQSRRLQIQYVDPMANARNKRRLGDLKRNVSPVVAHDRVRRLDEWHASKCARAIPFPTVHFPGPARAQRLDFIWARKKVTVPEG